MGLVKNTGGAEMKFWRMAKRKVFPPTCVLLDTDTTTTCSWKFRSSEFWHQSQFQRNIAVELNETISSLLEKVWCQFWCTLFPDNLSQRLCTLRKWTGTRSANLCSSSFVERPSIWYLKVFDQNFRLGLLIAPEPLMVSARGPATTPVQIAGPYITYK